MTCESCHTFTVKVILHGTALWCASCVETERGAVHAATGVIGDECDITQENGFRHPRRFTSKRELVRALAEQGKEMRVRHVPIPGTDKSPYTTDWSKGSIDPYTLAAASALMARNGTAKGNEPAMEPLHVKWQVRDVDPRTGPGAWRDCAEPK